MKEEKNVKRIKSVFFIIIVVLLIAITYKILEILYLNVELDEQNNIISGYNTTSTENVLNYDSVQISKSVESKEKEKMRNIGIPEEILNQVVIKNGDIYNYSEWKDFFDKYFEYGYFDVFEDSIKVINYTDDVHYDEIVFSIKTAEQNEVTYEGTLTIAKNDEVQVFNYYTSYVKRRPIRNSENEIFIDYYFENSDTNFELFKYSLSSTSYLGSVEFSYDYNKVGSKEYYTSQDIPGLINDIYVLNGMVTVRERGDEDFISLKNALEAGIVSYERIKSQCMADASYGKCSTEMFRDGGSIVYSYLDYNVYIIKEIKDTLEDGSVLIEEKGLLFTPSSMTLEQAKNWIDPTITID